MATMQTFGLNPEKHYDEPTASSPFPGWIINGGVRQMGCQPPKADFGGLMKFGAENPIILPAKWEPITYRPVAGQVWNQGNHGSCVGHGSTKAFEIAYRLAGGTIPDSGFSPTSLYALINGNRDQGAIVSDAMDSLMSDGVCTMRECPETIIYRRQIPSSADETRKRFRVSAAYHCDTPGEMVSALLLGFPVSFGMTIRAGWNRPGRDGLIPSGGMPLGGHCIAAVGLVKLADGRWGLLIMNSWDLTWGDGGFAIIPIDDLPSRGLDAFAVQCSQVDPLDPNRPTPATA